MKMEAVRFKLLILLVFVIRLDCLGWNPQEILVSVTIDVNNEEVLREGVRLFLSIVQFGGSLKSSVVDICLVDKVRSQDSSDKVTQLVTYFSSFGIQSLNIRGRLDPDYFPRSTYSQTINKLCSFEAIEDYRKTLDLKYFLYLDADLFILQDPLPLLEKELFRNGKDKTIYCSRPWNSFTELEYFTDFVFYQPHLYSGSSSARLKNSLMRSLFSSSLEEINNWKRETNNDFFPFLETISPGGQSLHGLCNTGLYFMNITTAEQVYRDSLYYLSIVEDFANSIATHREDITSPEKKKILTFYNKKHTMVDSLIIWAAIMYRDYLVRLLPIEMNLIVPAGDYLLPFLQMNESLQIPVMPTILHLSRGSDLLFEMMGNNSSSSSCVVYLLGARNTGGKQFSEGSDSNNSLFDTYFQYYLKYLSSEPVCSWFARELNVIFPK
jgi:hypothetical protein